MDLVKQFGFAGRARPAEYLHRVRLGPEVIGEVDAARFKRVEQLGCNERGPVAAEDAAHRPVEFEQDGPLAAASYLF
nr:hypothetical protein GCM10020063_094980 [Dactylosporangium thailandense]